MDVLKNRILEFDFTGRFLKTTALESGYAEFVRTRDAYLFDCQQRGIETGNVLLFADSNGASIKDIIPIIGRGISYGGSKFQVCKDSSVLYLPSFSHTIYKIDKENNVSPFYSFDFGNHWADSAECDQFVGDPSGDPFALWKHLKKSDKIGFLRFTDAPNQLILHFEKQEKQYNFFYDKKREKQYLVEYEEKKKNSLAEYMVIGNEGNEFVTVVPAYEYSQLKGLTKLPIGEEDNPVLVLYHIL
jgi:hypothetical protein